MDWHSPEIVFGMGTAWTGIMLGALRYMFMRGMAQLDDRLKAIDNHEKRLMTLEACLGSPGNCQQHAEQLITFRALHARIDTVAQSMHRVDGRLEGIGRAVDLMNEFLINRGDK